MSIVLKAATLCALAALAACTRTVATREVVREQPIVQQAAPERVVIVQQPAAPAETRPAAPAASGYTWVPGYYEWRNGKWEWTSGHWATGSIAPMPPARQETPPPAPYAGARWVPGYWSFAGSEWIWRNGHWL
jgi:hypothetical protein